jgi:hypothetical protein
MKSNLRIIPAFAALSLAFLAFAGCASAPETSTGSAVENTGEVTQALGVCASDCTPTTSCSASCYIDGAQGLQNLTCGQYGRCGTAPPVPPPPVCVVQCTQRGSCPPGIICITAPCLQWKTVCS